MSSTMMMERAGLGMPGMGMPGMGASTMGAPSGVTPASGYLMVPRCTMKFEKIAGGMKIVCVCDDQMACSMMQNLTTMLQGGLYSCCTTMNGMTVCSCNLTLGLCKCEMTDKGISLTYTSGDGKCGEMIQACCDCLSCMMNAGCTCCLMMNNTPVACGCPESGMTHGKSAAKR
jgi:hypothetical protein